MTADESAQLVRAMIRDLWNLGDADAVERYAGAHLQDEMRTHHAELMSAFSDVSVGIEDLVADGDRVAVRLLVSGTHDRGTFAGQAPTGVRARWGSFRFFRIADGRIVETWAMQDRLGLLQQLGALPGTDTGVHWAAAQELPQ
jgi:predicted ester cyclase